MRAAAMLCGLTALLLPGCSERGIIPMPVQSQQQAQDTVLGHLRRTLAALPAGAVLDATRYGGAGHNSYCDDGDSGPTAPVRFHTIGELTVPGAQNTVAAVGEIWRGWGWQVEDRDGFRTPNRFGRSPDGYRLQIVTAAVAGHPPTLQASSPCFPRHMARDDIPFPDVLDRTT